MVRKKKSEQEIKKFKITYMIPNIACPMTIESNELDKDVLIERFTRLFKDYKIIKIEAVK